MIFRQIIYLILGLLVLFLILHILIRIIGHFNKSPIPNFLVNLIDNPLRRRIQPRDGMPLRHGILPGMKVLEIGPGNGSYTLASARRVGPESRLPSAGFSWTKKITTGF